jgi:hypothetical protein
LHCRLVVVVVLIDFVDIGIAAAVVAVAGCSHEINPLAGDHLL